MPPRRAARSVSRKSIAQSPPKASSTSVLIDASNENKRSTRSASHHVAAVQHQLQNIDEVAASLNGISESQHEYDDGIGDRMSPSRESTSQGSDLQSLLDSLDVAAIIDNINLLHGDSIDLLDLFEGHGDAALRALIRNLADANSTQRKRLRTRERRFLTSLEPYADSGYIKPGLVLESLGVKDAGRATHSSWRPDPVLYLANLALQMMSVLSLEPETRIDYIEFMLNNFPTPFADDEVFAIGEDMLEETADVTIDILTQFYIYRADVDKARPQFNPETLLEQIFRPEEETLRPFLHPSAPEKINQREEAIRNHFGRHPRHPLDIDSLTREFPWADFVVKITKWSMSRKQELEELINSTGGIDAITSMLSAKFSADTVEATIEADREAETAANELDKEQGTPTDVRHRTERQESVAGPPTGNKLNARNNRLMQLRALYAAENSGADPSLAMVDDVGSVRSIPQSPTPADDEASAQVPESPAVGDQDNGSEIDSIVLTQQTDTILAVIRRQKEQSEKENKAVTTKKRSFLDRQEDAERVTFSFAPEEEEAPPVRPANKRQRSETEPSEDDDDYETDPRAAAKKRRIADTQDTSQSVGVGDLDRSSRAPATQEGDTIENNDGDDGDEIEDEQHAPFPQEGRLSRSILDIVSRAGRDRSQQREPPSTAPPRPQRESTEQRTNTRGALRSISEHRPSASRAPTSQRPAPAPASSAPARNGSPPHGRDDRIHQEPPSTQLARVNQEAKFTARLSREIYQGSKTQVRKQYTAAEVDRLMEMIAIYGTKWSAILKEDLAHPDGPLLQNRSQVQLKDKARNIKLDFLKARHPLPEGFELVSIGPRQVEILRELGIDYVQNRFDGAKSHRTNDDDDED